MQNKELRQRVEEIFAALKGLKAHQIESQLQLSKNIVQGIIGDTQIQKIRNSTLLKLLSYQLIIFVDQKTQQTLLPSTRRSNEYSRLSQRSSQASISVKQIKSLLANLNSKRLFKSGDLKLTFSQFEEIVARINVIEEQLSKEENRKKSLAYTDDDQDGNQLIIEQLELLLKKKQGRIKELNQELEQNFLDKQELQQEIDELQHRNIQLEELVKSMEIENAKLKQEFEKYKVQQKEDLLFGASQFMNITLPHKQIQQVQQASRNRNYFQEQPQHTNADNHSDLSQSTKMLSRYCSNSEDKQPNSQTTPKNFRDFSQKTAKKPCTVVRNQDIQQNEEQNLLQSVRVKKKPQLLLENTESSLQRMLFIQAIFIEQTLQNILAQ